MRIKNELVDQFMPEALLVGRTGGHLTLAVPRSVGIDLLQNFLRKLEERKDIVKNWGIRQTTLEEVFLAISRHAEKIEHLKTVLNE